MRLSKGGRSMNVIDGLGSRLQRLKIPLRFVLPLILSLIVLAYLMMPLVDKLTLHWTIRDLDMRSELIAQTMEEPLSELIKQGNRGKILAIFNRALRDERLFAIAYCDKEGNIIYRTNTFPTDLDCEKFVTEPGKSYTIRDLFKKPVHLKTYLLEGEDQPLGILILVHDISYAEHRSADTQRYLFFLFVVIGLIVSAITVIVAHLSWREWMQGVRSLLRGKSRRGPVPAEVKPLVADLRNLLRSLDADRRLTDDLTVIWNPQKLRELLRAYMRGEQIIVVSNREPYIHVKGEAGIEVRRPASGLVTAIEPIMRACSGTWIAHGSGTADREVVDANDHVRVPPGKEQYTLRRIWLSAAEEQGHYYGFSNEGLWPLCHIAHIRPVFRNEDWEYYMTVNRRFAKAVAEEATTEDPLVLVQDYHLPCYLR